MERKTDLQILIGRLTFVAFVFESSEETNESLHFRQGRLGFVKKDTQTLQETVPSK